MKQEQLLREVKMIGNGAHVFAPKEWLGEKVFIVRVPEKPLKERILLDLGDYLEDIEGIYLYGSHARREADENSDVDILVVTLKKMKIKVKGYEIIAIGKNKIGEAVKLEPLVIYSILSEAKPIFNFKLLEDLRVKYKPRKNDFRKYLRETERVIKINRELLELEREGQIRAGEIAYSLVLRLRGVYLIKCLLNGRSYLNRDFVSWIGNKELYRAYRDYKSRSVSRVVDREELVELLELLKREVKNLKGKIYGEKKKTS